LFCGCFEFEVLKLELDPKSVGDLIIPSRPQFHITKHLNLILLFQRAKFFRGCFEFGIKKVELDPQHMGYLITPPRPRAKFFCGFFEFEVFEGGIGPQKRGGPHNSAGAPISNHQTSKFSTFVSKNEIFCGCFEFEV
jgi:hypothetical protein